MIQTRQGAKEGVAAEGSLATLVFDVKETQAPGPPVQLIDVQLADSRTRAIPVDLVAERVLMTELFPDKPMLLQNYPNPFNPKHGYRISSLPIQKWLSQFTIHRVRLSVESTWVISRVGTYTTRGRAVYWDGRNEFGERVGSGMYFYQLQAGDYSAIRKVVILK